MDPHAFDRATRLFRTPRSRRTAWRALLSGALLGATVRRGAVAAPSDTSKAATCAGAWCPGKCFRNVNDVHDELCCTGQDSTGQDLIICGNKCCQDVGEDPCDCCLDPGDEIVIAAADDPCPGGITGSYRRR